MTKPPYPTEITNKWKDDADRYDTDPAPLEESVNYWLTPRKCSEVPPEFPCLMFDERHLEWRHIWGEKWERLHEAQDTLTHWLPVPPAPSDEP
jgi:hypothetical protein